MKKTFVLIFCLSLGCVPAKSVRPPEGLPICEQSCSMLHVLDCSEAADVAACVQVCERVSQLGYLWGDSKSGPQCVVASDGTVHGVRKCKVACAQ